MRHGRNEPAGLHGLRKQVTEIEVGPLELRRKAKKGKEKAPGGRRGGKAQRVPESK